MKQTKQIMGMPVTVEVIGKDVKSSDLAGVFKYFRSIDQSFSTYKALSEISLINSGKITLSEISPDMKKVFELAAKTKKETGGYFDIQRNGQLDPSGIVKGWAILNAANLLRKKGYKDFYIEAGGDIQSSGKNASGEAWKVGIRNPFNTNEIIKVINLTNQGIATSGTYEKGGHIYNPKSEEKSASGNIVSLTVIAKDVLEADRFATAAFAMGEKGINFIENLPGIEAYMVDKSGIATLTTGFEKYL